MEPVFQVYLEHKMVLGGQPGKAGWGTESSDSENLSDSEMRKLLESVCK